MTPRVRSSTFSKRFLTHSLFRRFLNSFPRGHCLVGLHTHIFESLTVAAGPALVRAKELRPWLHTGFSYDKRRQLVKGHFFRRPHGVLFLGDVELDYHGERPLAGGSGERHCETEEYRVCALSRFCACRHLPVCDLVNCERLRLRLI